MRPLQNLPGELAFSHQPDPGKGSAVALPQEHTNPIKQDHKNPRPDKTVSPLFWASQAQQGARYTP
jgi:hypothetical protein